MKNNIKEVQLHQWSYTVLTIGLLFIAAYSFSNNVEGIGVLATIGSIISFSNLLSVKL